MSTASNHPNTNDNKPSDTASDALTLPVQAHAHQHRELLPVLVVLWIRAGGDGRLAELNVELRVIVLPADHIHAGEH
jgi:hypothetical protein